MNSVKIGQRVSYSDKGTITYGTMSRHERKLNYIRAVEEYVAAERIRKKRLHICDTILKIAAAGMLIAALYVVHGM